MKIVFIIIFGLFFTVNSFSQEIKAELSLISPPSVLKEGDIFEGVLRVWPLENSSMDEFKKIENTTLAKLFYITEVERVEASINNSEVTEAKLLIIVKHSDGKDERPLTFRDKVVNIIPPQLPMAPTTKASGDYYVMNQEIAYSNLMAIIIAILIIMLMVLAYYKRISIRQFYKKFRNDSNSILAKRFKDKFANARKREDFEEIYAIRNEWQHLIKTPNDSYNNFFKTIEMHQYKKNWSDDELQEVKKSFDPIRGSLA